LATTHTHDDAPHGRDGEGEEAEEHQHRRDQHRRGADHVREQVHSPATRQLATCATSATDDVKKKAQDVLNTNNGDVSMTATRRRPG
jgi:hypothetical protein